MEVVTIIIVFVVVTAAIALLDKYHLAQTDNEFRQRMKQSMGKVSWNKADRKLFDYVTRYYEKHKTDTSIDDITWNDLCMDDVFEKVNYCCSPFGEEYLYYTLRNPNQTDAFDTLEDSISYYTAHDQVRICIQSVLHGASVKKTKYSLYDYLDYLNDSEKKSNLSNYVCLVILALSIAGCFINFGIAFCIFLIVCIYNIVTYFKQSDAINKYLSGFSEIFRLVSITGKLHKLNDVHIEQELSETLDDEKELQKFRHGSWIVMSSGKMNSNAGIFDVLMDYVRMLTHIDLIRFNQMLSDVKIRFSNIDNLYTAVARIDTEIAICYFRASLDGKYCLPDFNHEQYSVKEIYHPGINNPVSNDITCGREVLLTGSNASGKSTFLKTVGIGCILAQSIHTVLASEYKAPMYRVFSSMALRDDLTVGESYYIVEIKSLKRIFDAAVDNGCRVMCLIDEVLRGTNTVERIAASSQILSKLGEQDVQCFAATHDIELAYLLEDKYENYHFEGEVTHGNVIFDYILKKGTAQKRNAISLLRILGYDKSIVDNAEKMAQNFTAEGIWRMI